ncbi:MAG: hypothetical protein OXU26_06675 [Acidobacteriota bacterium]|nr:hypothetical protein [Acidobacteriota bacterium]
MEERKSESCQQESTGAETAHPVEAEAVAPRGRRGRPLRNAATRARQAVGRGRNAAFNLGGSIQESIRKSLHDPRDYVVMVRVSKESLERLDELVECGILSSRSTAAAFLIAEGVSARTDLYEKIAEQTEVIREAREKLQRLLED